MRVQRHSIIASLVVATQVAGISYAQTDPDPESAFLEQHRQHEPMLYERYISNRKIKVRVTFYNNLEPTGILGGHTECTIVSRADAFRVNASVLRAGEKLPAVAGVLWLGDEAYSLSRTGSSEYSIDTHATVVKHRGKVEELAERWHLFLPLSFNGGFRLRQHFEIMNSQKKRGYHFAVKSVNTVSLEGRPAVKVVTTGGRANAS